MNIAWAGLYSDGQPPASSSFWGLWLLEPFATSVFWHGSFDRLCFEEYDSPSPKIRIRFSAPLSLSFFLFLFIKTSGFVPEFQYTFLPCPFKRKMPIKTRYTKLLFRHSDDTILVFSASFLFLVCRYILWWELNRKSWFLVLFIWNDAYVSWKELYSIALFESYGLFLIFGGFEERASLVSLLVLRFENWGLTIEVWLPGWFIILLSLFSSASM